MTGHSANILTSNDANMDGKLKSNFLGSEELKSKPSNTLFTSSYLGLVSMLFLMFMCT